MPLTLVLGPANSAKAGEVLGAYAGAARGGALLVVPTAADAGHYARELAERGCVIGAVLTFGGLVEEIARRTGYRSRRLSALQRELVMRRALAGCRLGVVREAASAPGFPFAVLRLIAELEREMVSAPRLVGALDRWAQGEPRRQAYARDVGALYLAYRDELDRRAAVDAELFAWGALDTLRGAPGRWGVDPVYFYGFDDLHGLECDAIETLCRIVGVEVTVSLTYEAGRPALSARAELVGHLRALARRVVELPPASDYYHPASRDALHHLERSLFGPGPSGYRPDPGPAVQLLEAGGELAEAELVAAEVSKLLEEGLPRDQIAVLCRRLGPTTAEALTRAFARRGIPVWADRTVPFGHTALGRSVLALARSALAGPDAAGSQDVLDYLRAPGVLSRPEQADELEVKIRCQGLGGAAQALEALGFEPIGIVRVRRASDPLAALVHEARRLIAAPHRRRAPLLPEEAELDARALAALARCADELSELGESPSGEELVELLGRLELPAGAASPPADAVTIADPLAVRARRFRAVFVCDLQEGSFPCPPQPDPFLPDDRRRELAALSGLRLPTREDGLDRERYLFYSCVSRATERLFLSWRSSDEEGNPALPSPFIEDVAEVLHPRWRERRKRRLLADVGDEPPQAGMSVASDGATGGSGSGPVGSRRRLGAAALARARHTRILSAGALERYAACPMRWLVESELCPQALEPPPDPLERGTYMHEVLERVLSRLGGAVTPESLPEAMRVLEEVLTEASPLVAPGAGAALRRAAALAIAADLRRYLEYEAACGVGWPPQALELRFGFEPSAPGEQQLPPLRLGEGEEAIAVRGMIDRVDVEPAGRRAVIRDYKSGAALGEHQGSRWRTDRQLQVALYMVAVRRLLGLEPVAGLYQPLGGRDLRPRGIYLHDSAAGAGLLPADARDPGAFEEELDAACRDAVALAARLRAGELEPTPATCSREGCRYPGICRAGEIASGISRAR